MINDKIYIVYYYFNNYNCQNGCSSKIIVGYAKTETGKDKLIKEEENRQIEKYNQIEFPICVDEDFLVN